MTMTLLDTSSFELVIIFLHHLSQPVALLFHFFIN